MEGYILLLIFIPLIFSGLFLLGRSSFYYKTLSVILSVVGIISSLLLIKGGPSEFELTGYISNFMDPTILGSEVLLLIYLYKESIKHRRWTVLGIIFIQTIIMLYNFVFIEGTKILGGQSHVALSVDKLSLALAVIINVIGTLILVFANSYMSEYEKHRKMKSRQRVFYSVICFFLSAMNGLIISDSLTWLYFFWEITTISSFVLISYNGDEEAVKSGFRALTLNLIGGIAFSIAMLLLHNNLGIESLSALAAQEDKGKYLILPVMLLCTAGFVKSAQMPFQSWLLGAMVAPTPVSALLHSSTMVNAGVYLIVKLSPAYAGTKFGTAIAIYGSISFLLCSAAAVSQRNAKRVLAYSTIANLGLVISSAGMGTPMAISAAIMLIIFHAISKALLFLCVGQIEHTIGSRDIEDMAGLIEKSPALAFLTALGMISMLLPPFGVLITKWLSIEAAAKNPVVAVILVLGSALTTVFWIKWLGTILSKSRIVKEKRVKLSGAAAVPLWSLGLFILLTSVLLTPLFNYFVSPEVSGLLGVENQINAVNGKMISQIGSYNGSIIFLLILIVFIVYFLIKKFIMPVQIKKIYMCGENISSTKGESYFREGLGGFQKAEVSNYYLTDVLNEIKINEIGVGITVLLLVYLMIGGLL